MKKQLEQLQNNKNKNNDKNNKNKNNDHDINSHKTTSKCYRRKQQKKLLTFFLNIKKLFSIQ